MVGSRPSLLLSLNSSALAARRDVAEHASFTHEVALPQELLAPLVDISNASLVTETDSVKEKGVDKCGVALVRPVALCWRLGTRLGCTVVWWHLGGR